MDYSYNLKKKIVIMTERKTCVVEICVTFGTGVYRKSVHCEIKKIQFRTWVEENFFFYSDSRIIIAAYRIFLLALR